MNARLAQLARNLRRRNSPAAATPPPSDAKISAAPVGDQPSGSSERQVSAPIEVVSGEARRSRLLTLLVSQVNLRSVSERVSTAVKARAKDPTNPVNARAGDLNTKHLKDLVAWWKQAHEELKTPSSKTAHTRVEEHLAHVLMQSLDQAQAKKKEALETKAEADARVAELEGQVADLEARLTSAIEGNKKVVVDAVEHGRAEGFSAGFIEGFDQAQLDSSLDATLQPYTEETIVKVAGDDESKL
ncbi:hypothetical protein Salat_1900300 [Sesamum alatum]|uniref:Uncharacterized protein n=1 Tax=Sesamum alatum TaxID=300844 RepID=A0AAE1Y3P2_9LAMI|nr:hypothetical protein Salat_1900300 [Sesamum alatum]